MAPVGAGRPRGPDPVRRGLGGHRPPYGRRHRHRPRRRRASLPVGSRPPRRRPHPHHRHPGPRRRPPPPPPQRGPPRPGRMPPHRSRLRAAPRPAPGRHRRQAPHQRRTPQGGTRGQGAGRPRGAAGDRTSGSGGSDERGGVLRPAGRRRPTDPQARRALRRPARLQGRTAGQPQRREGARVLRGLHPLPRPVPAPHPQTLLRRQRRIQPKRQRALLPIPRSGRRAAQYGHRSVANTADHRSR